MNRPVQIKKILLAFALVNWAEPVHAALSATEIYVRCYSQLTLERPKYTDSQTLSVREGKTNPIDACLAILDRAKLAADGNSRIVDVNDLVAKSVLRTLHNLHSSWFSVRNYLTNSSGDRSRGTRDMFDTSGPALYFTRALFGNSIPFRSIVETPEALLAVRTEMEPIKGAFSNVEKVKYTETPTLRFAPKGELLGVKTETTPAILTWVDKNDKNSLTQTHDLAKSWGGGFLGTQIYILQTVREPRISINGGTVLPRKWGQAVFRDALCRELPVVREVDYAQFTVPSSSVPFRQTQTCVGCHASMDRISGLIRGYTYKASYGVAELFNLLTPTLPADPVWPVPPKNAQWPEEPDNKFSLRPATGHFFYRSSSGELIDVPVTNIGELGRKIGTLDDLYICAAKRYYEYFTGISANIQDVGAPGSVALNAADLAVRSLVIAMGKRLKQSQSARSLIKEILQHPSFIQPDFGKTTQRSLSSD